jgi:hypothetical protein
MADSHLMRKILAAVFAAIAGAAAFAQTDEIQVYDAGIAEPGHFEMTLHDNYTPSGQRDAAFHGGVVPNHSWNGVPEFAYGVTEWFEAGLYLPVYTIRADGRAELDSAKLRALFVSPDAAHREFFYGANFELSYNAAHWEPTRLSGEIRLIGGMHLGDWDVIVNPILDTDFKGLKQLDFAPAGRVAYNLSERWAVGGEYYAEFGHWTAILPANKQSHAVYGIVDFKADEEFSAEFGIGAGLTPATDGLVLKLILNQGF